MLDAGDIDEIKEFVSVQCDVVKNTVGKLKDKKFIHRYIHPMIYNIVEYSLGLLDEECAFQMLQALAEGLQLQRNSQNR